VNTLRLFSLVVALLFGLYHKAAYAPNYLGWLVELWELYWGFAFPKIRAMKWCNNRDRWVKVVEIRDLGLCLLGMTTKRESFGGMI